MLKKKIAKKKLKPAKKVARKAPAKKKVAPKKVTKKITKSVSAKPAQSLEQLFDAFFAAPVQKKEVKNSVQNLDELFNELFSETEKEGETKSDFDDIFEDVVPTPTKSITLEELFADLETPANAFDTAVEEISQDLKKAQTTSIFTSVVTPKVEEAAEIELSAIMSGQTFMRKLFGSLGVALAAFVIGLLWLQVTYGYFTALDNTSNGDKALNEIIYKNVEPVNQIKADIEKTYNSAKQQYQQLKNK